MTVVEERQIAVIILPVVNSSLKFRLYIIKTTAARNARIPTILIAPQGINFIKSPPKLQHKEASAIKTGPLILLCSTLK